MKIIIIVAVIFIIYKVITKHRSFTPSNSNSIQSDIPKQPIKKRSNPHRILLCDDAAFMRMMLKDILTQDGYEVVAEAQNGLEAIERYSEFKPDLVFMDITMPIMDGIDATRKIKEMDSHANIVVCSAMGQQEQVIEAIHSGAKDFIVKPFSKEATLEAVMKIFEPWRFVKPPVEAKQSQTPTAQEQSILDAQTQTTSTTPPVQTQSILDTQTLFDYIKDMPVKWEYANPNVSTSKDLQQLCNTFLTGMEIPKCYSRESIMDLEYTIQTKRARTPNKAEYNKVMERNILFELYKYSYYMNFFKVLEDRKNDKVDVDKTELANLIREDCIKRFGNMEYEKRKTPAIQSVLQKYEFDTQGVKMIVNDYVEPREYDYIYASLMTLTLLNIVNFVLYSELKIGNGYQPTIEIVRKYPASDFIAALDTYLASTINLALNMYTSGGKLPTRPQ